MAYEVFRSPTRWKPFTSGVLESSCGKGLQEIGVVKKKDSYLEVGD